MDVRGQEPEQPGARQLAWGIQEGWIRAAEESEPGPVRRATAARRVAQALDEDRR